MEPGPPEGGLWPQPASCCCSVLGPAWQGRWAREGQPVLSGECLETGRGGGAWGPDPAAHWEWMDRVSFPTRPGDLYRVGL